jgi:hypothetical protein
MPVCIFISAVSDEFRDYRDQLRADLTRHNVEVKVQEDFKNLGGGTLEKLDTYIAQYQTPTRAVSICRNKSPAAGNKPPRPESSYRAASRRDGRLSWSTNKSQPSIGVKRWNAWFGPAPA